jgi:hypothetical protein
MSSLTRRGFALLVGSLPLLRAQAPARLPRRDSFFGLHFDLHPNAEDKSLGRDVTEEMIENILQQAQPDYVQYDSKGHPGWLGWPSKVGPSAPGIVNDSLAIWRRVTARRGVALYIHFSGIWDSETVKRHPDWARVDAEGKRSANEASTFGPYVDDLMIPELREAAARYQLDGAWVDGECWATKPDYYPGVKEAFRKATGIAELPAGPNSPGWQEFLSFNREQFRKYVRRYVDALHRSNPGFQIASNWLYSTFVPEEPELPVDFLSGDFLGNASISTARLDARYLAQTGRPWDLMAWGFQQAESNTVGEVHKPAVQLQQEASVVLAQGGGFQIYMVPSRAGYFDEKMVKTMADVGRFCRARQTFAHHSETVPQIGVVFSKETLYRTTNRLFGGWGKAADPARGMVDALVGCQWSVDVVPDWKLERVAAGYPFLVLPDWAAPGQAVAAALLDYARKGGTLLVAGADNAALFAPAMGVRLSGKPAKQPAYLSAGEVLGNATGVWQDIDPGPASVLQQRTPTYDTRKDARPAAVSARAGAGEIVMVPGPLGSLYAATHAEAIRRFTRALVEPRFKPLVRVDAPPPVEVVLRRKNGDLMVHLLNTTGMQVAGDFATVDYVPPVGPVRLTLGAEKPRAMTMEPEGLELNLLQFDAGWGAQLFAFPLYSIIRVVK